MKTSILSRFPILVILVTFCFNPILSQNQFFFEGMTLIRENDKLFLLEKEKKYEVIQSIITVKFYDNTNDALKNSIFTKYDLEIIRKNKLGYYDVKVDNKQDILTLFQNCRLETEIQSLDINTFGEYGSTPNDTYFSNQWYLYQVSDKDVDATDAWNLSTGINDVIVAILDSGTDFDHEDLGPSGYQDVAQNIWRNVYDSWSNSMDPSTGNGIDDDNNGYIDDYKGWDFD